MLLAALILRTDRSIVRQLRLAKATSIGTASPVRVPHAIGSWRLRRLSGVGALGEVESGRFFLREDKYADYQRRRKQKVLLVAGVVLLLLAVVFIRRTRQFRVSSFELGVKSRGQSAKGKEQTAKADSMSALPAMRARAPAFPVAKSIT
jgi:hypothetical protein